MRITMSNSKWAAVAAITFLFCAHAGPVGAQIQPGVPNLPAQIIGPNDLIAVSVYDSPELTRTIRVGQDGYIRLPMMKGRIKSVGLMPNELATEIAAALEKEELLVEPFVTVTIAEYNSRPISVAGAVKQPLTFQAAGPVSLLEAITRAGGLSADAGAEILVSHAKSDNDNQSHALLQRFLVKDLIDGTNPASNIGLTGGEEVRVPEAGRIYVIGNVKKPGAFPVSDGKDSTILKMLALSEGLSPYAGKDAFIYRREASGAKSEIRVHLSQIMTRKTADETLLPDDILYVPDNQSRRMTLGALEKVLLFGTGATSALIYAGVR